MHFYQFNLGDYASATQHLDDMEDLAYRRMLDLYYMKESPLPKDIKVIAKLIRMRPHIECIKFVLDEFFTLVDGGYHNRGADKALNKVYKKSDAARKSAEARWNKNKGLSDANAMRTQCETDADDMLPNTQDPIPNTQVKNNSINSQSVVDAYHECLPTAAKIQVVSDKRKLAIKTFFKKRSKEKGSDFTLENFKAYLGYISTKCKWMLEDRPNNSGGFWKAKNFDYFLKDDCYIAVKEERHNDMG